ncbi:MAG: multidrug ABC transporter ATP-binding protein [Methanosphaera sp. rholeuAM270]|nr:MAG: multidrug ABC transporter ATP-binding protein [Methanosphaera sp. rholeuAM270]
MTEYVIETTNLTKKYKNKTVVNKINMKIEKGKIYGLLGKNGAGKTTTMRMLLNLASKTSGEIKIFQNKPDRETYKKIGTIIETPGFYENLTAEENLTIISKIRENYSKEKIKQTLKLVSLNESKNKKYKEYSLGMRQRLAIASAIIHEPELLILDEPINGLDPIGIKEIRHLLKKLSRENNTTILISSHILSEIENMADIIGVMDNGKLIKELTKEELHNQLHKNVNFEVSNTNKASQVLEKIGLHHYIDYEIQDKNRILLYTHLNNRDKINELFVKNDIKVQKINLNEENLEEYFTRIINPEKKLKT